MKQSEFEKLEVLELLEKEKAQVKGGTGDAIGGALDAAGGLDGDSSTFY